ncbi:hypothetical protein [Viridibacillus arvi]|uniref:hypothetical protein n=1 Tax=Viridibacillus arvi TaxID=263475 RepID=UPI00187B29B1|nr:hypothetical protein [Viridibacillus sp. JNUCC-6]QOV10926.1 hypothetical protein JNUCC6_20550 [Viridibacillus sp. JNUCC-6]
MDELKEYRARKNGEVTPKVLLEKTMDDLENIEVIIMVIKQKDGIIHMGCSDAMCTEHIGLLEVGKKWVIDDMEE